MNDLGPNRPPTRHRAADCRASSPRRRMSSPLLPCLGALLALTAPLMASGIPTYFHVALKARDQLEMNGSGGAGRLTVMLKQCDDAYLAGALGPDVCITDDELMDSGNTGWYAHYESPRAIVMEMLEQAQKAPTRKDRERNIAFVLGWITHCCTDWRTEGLISQFKNWSNDKGWEARRAELQLVESIHVFQRANDADQQALRQAYLQPRSVPLNLVNDTFSELFKERDTNSASRKHRTVGKGAVPLTPFELQMLHKAFLMGEMSKGFIQNSKSLKPRAFPRGQMKYGPPPTPDEYRELMDPLSIDDVTVERAGANSKLVVKYTIRDFRLYKLFCRKWDKLIPRAATDAGGYLRQYSPFTPEADDPEEDLPNLNLPKRPLAAGKDETGPGDPIITGMLGFLTIRTADGADLSPWPKDGEWVNIPSRTQWRAATGDNFGFTSDPRHKWEEEEGWNGPKGNGQFEIPFDDKGADGVSIGLRLAFADSQTKKLYGEGDSIAAYWSWTNAPPTDVVFVIDKSAQMAPALKQFQEQFYDVTDKLKEASGGARVGIVTYGPAPGPSLANKPAPGQVEFDLDDDMSAAEGAVKRISATEQDSVTPRGNAPRPRPILAALSTALQQKWTGRFKIVILIADAETTLDARGGQSVNQIAWTALKLDPVDIHTVLVGPTADPKSPATQPFVNLSALCRGQTYAAKRPEDVVGVVREAVRSGIETCFRPPVDTSRLPSIPRGPIASGGGGIGGGGGGGGDIVPTTTPTPAPAPPASKAVPAIIALSLCVILAAAIAVTLLRRRTAAPEAWLAPTRAGQPSLPLTRGTIVIGRGAQATLQLNDDQVSSAHASLQWSPSGYLLTDHASTNGTFVNGRRIAAPTILKTGDVIRIGRTELRLAGSSS